MFRELTLCPYFIFIKTHKYWKVLDYVAKIQNPIEFPSIETSIEDAQKQQKSILFILTNDDSSIS